MRKLSEMENFRIANYQFHFCSWNKKTAPKNLLLNEWNNFYFVWINDILTEFLFVFLFFGWFRVGTAGELYTN